MTEARFSIAVHYAGSMRVWMTTPGCVHLSADKFGVTQSLTLMDLTDEQSDALCAAFGCWSKPAPSEHIDSQTSPPVPSDSSPVPDRQMGCALDGDSKSADA